MGAQAGDVFPLSRHDGDQRALVAVTRYDEGRFPAVAEEVPRAVHAEATALDRGTMAREAASLEERVNIPPELEGGKAFPAGKSCGCTGFCLPPLSIRRTDSELKGIRDFPTAHLGRPGKQAEENCYYEGSRQSAAPKVAPGSLGPPKSFPHNGGYPLPVQTNVEKEGAQ